MDYLDKPDPQTFIAHHGIKGQKWGVRRFQNADGSLTKAGKERYNEQNSSDSSDNHENQKFHLTEKQKKYCKTVAIATGAALVAYAGFKLADSGELNRLCISGGLMMKEQRFDKQQLKSAIKFKSTNMLLEEFISDYFKRHPEAKHTSQAERRLKREFYLSILKRSFLRKSSSSLDN